MIADVLTHPRRTALYLLLVAVASLAAQVGIGGGLHRFLFG